MASKKQLKILAQTVLRKAEKLGVIGFNYYNRGASQSSAYRELKSMNATLDVIEKGRNTPPVRAISFSRCRK
jgi:hypothetical protein